MDHLGVMLGSSWLQLGPLGSIVALSWAILSSLGAHLGSSWALSGAKNHAKTVGKTMFGDITRKIDKADAYFTTLHTYCGRVGLSEALYWIMLNEVGVILGPICGQEVPAWVPVGSSLASVGSKLDSKIMKTLRKIDVSAHRRLCWPFVPHL